MVIEELQKRRKIYPHNLTGKVAVLDVKKAELKRIKETLEIYEAERKQLVEGEQLLQDRLAEIDCQILVCEKSISAEESRGYSLQKKLNRVFLLSFGNMKLSMVFKRVQLWQI